MDSTSGFLRACRNWLAALFWPANTSRNLGLILASLPVQLATPALAAIAGLVSWAVRADASPISNALTGLLVAVSALLLTAIALPALTLAQRRLLHSLREVDIRSPVTARRTTWRGLMAWVRAETTRRQLVYQVLVAPALAVAGLAIPALWTVGVVLCGSFTLVDQNVKGFQRGQPFVYSILTVLGAVLLIAAPRVAAAVIKLDIWATTSMLGPSRVAALEHRVETLTESRAGVVDAADAERRRIERDLHDGAQQRLVSLAMRLGLASAEFTDLPEDARRLIAEAHDEAKEALADLRQLVRGLHPAILEDRGLDAALSGIAARSPVPVYLDVHVPERVPPTVEAVAYFMVSEALTNTAKHSGATRADVAARRYGDVLRVIVADDGVGGADPTQGTGLAGLAQRVRSVDGTLSISSPAGGPTTIIAELSCA